MFFFFTRPEYALMRHPAWPGIIAMLDVVRRKHPNMTIGMLHTFLKIAKEQEAYQENKNDMKILSEELNMPYSTFIRQIDATGAGIANKNGLNLIEKRQLGSSRKMKTIDFTQDGVRLIEEMWEEIVDTEAKGNRPRRIVDDSTE